MIAIIITGIICLLGLLSLVHAVKHAPLIDDEKGFRDEDSNEDLLR
jgi:hypothetical protein